MRTDGSIVIGALAVVGLTVLVSPAIGQTVKQLMEQKFAILRADKTTTPLVPVLGKSKQTSKVRAMAGGGGGGSVEVAGSAAPLRVRSGDPQRFLVSMNHAVFEQMLRESETSRVVNLHKFDVKKDARQWSLGDFKPFGIHNRKIDVVGIPVNISRYDAEPDTMLIEPRETLAPGEYAFVTMNSDPYDGASWYFHAFGID